MAQAKIQNGMETGVHALELIVEQLAEIKTTLNDIVHRRDNHCENARMRRKLEQHEREYERTTMRENTGNLKIRECENNKDNKDNKDTRMAKMTRM